MYTKISRNDFIRLTGNIESHNAISVPYTPLSLRISVPKATKIPGSSTYSGGSNITGQVDDEYESPTTTAIIDIIPSTVNGDLVSVPPAWITSSSLVATPTYLPTILGTPILQGPAPNPGNGTAIAANQPTSQPEKHVLSGGAIAAISVITIMVVLALGLCLYRKWLIRKRKKKLADWWLPDPFLITPNSSIRTPLPMKERVVRNVPRVRPPSLPLPPVPVDLSGQESGTSAVPTFPVLHSMQAANVGLVRCVFEPRLADELRIRVGEGLRVLAEYDDGWGFCENVRGERGMVPMECLEGKNISSVATNAAGLLSLGQPSFARSSARKSSLLVSQSSPGFL